MRGAFLSRSHMRGLSIPFDPHPLIDLDNHCNLLDNPYNLLYSDYGKKDQKGELWKKPNRFA